jgi:hypothetical protein
LHEGLHTDDIGEWKAGMQRIVLKMVQDIQYEKDMVVTLFRGNYYKTTKRHPDETEIDIRDEVYTTPFILSSMNQTELPKRSLGYLILSRENLNRICRPIPSLNLSLQLVDFCSQLYGQRRRHQSHPYAAGKAN